MEGNQSEDSSFTTSAFTANPGLFLQHNVPLVSTKLSKEEVVELWVKPKPSTDLGPTTSVHRGTINSAQRIGPPPPCKEVNIIDISHESDSDDDVICCTPLLKTELTLTSPPTYDLNNSSSDNKLKTFRHHGLEAGGGDIEAHSKIENNNDVEVLPSTLFTRPSSGFHLNNSVEKIEIEKKLAILENSSPMVDNLAQAFERSFTLKASLVLEKPAEPQITADMKKVIERALSRPMGDVIVVTANNIEITRSDLKSLAPRQWLNDNVINSYLDLIALRSKSHLKWPSVYVFSTFFYPKYLKEGYSNILKRWTRKVDLFSYDLLIFPIHLHIHWCLAVADNRKKIIKYFDSLGGKNYQCLKALREYLTEEYKERKKSSLGNDWKLEVVEGIPQQQNGSDCGLFACKFAEYVSRDAELNFKQSQMNDYRYRMIYEIITGDLLYP